MTHALETNSNKLGLRDITTEPPPLPPGYNSPTLTLILTLTLNSNPNLKLASVSGRGFLRLRGGGGLPRVVLTHHKLTLVFVYE